MKYKQLIPGILMGVAGLILVIAAFLIPLDPFWITLGVALFFGSFTEIRDKYRRMKDAAYREAQDIEKNDERSQFIAGKACVMTVSSYLIIAFAALILSKVAGREDWMMFFAVNIGLIFLLYIVSYIAIKDKY